MQHKIEYLGRNVFDGCLIAEKSYYHWTDEELILPKDLKAFLKPFDYGKRDKGFDYSISAFIKGCNVKKLDRIIDYGIATCNLAINKNRFFKNFLSIADLPNDSHYDPIVSFKYNEGFVTGISFYVTALKNKTLMFSYLESVMQTLSLNVLPTISNIITDCVCSRCADMFQVSWDYGKCAQSQNKIYLKIKNADKFANIIQKDFPYLLEFMDIDGFRFCELAFVIKNKKLTMFNLYFKPL